MNVLIAYDINVPRHHELKDKLLAVSFSDVWNDSNYIPHYLPDTTMWIGNVMNVTQAISLFNNAIAELNEGKNPEDKIKATRLVATQMGMTLGIPGDPHS